MRRESTTEPRHARRSAPTEPHRPSSSGNSSPRFRLAFHYSRLEATVAGWKGLGLHPCFAEAAFSTAVRKSCNSLGKGIVSAILSPVRGCESSSSAACRKFRGEEIVWGLLE